MRLFVLALAETVWSTRGVMRGAWGAFGDSSDWVDEWTYSAHWRSRER